MCIASDPDMKKISGLIFKIASYANLVSADFFYLQSSRFPLCQGWLLHVKVGMRVNIFTVTMPTNTDV